MTYETESIDALKREGRLEARISGELGEVKDLRRSGVVVHVGKPTGSVSGWAGPVFWQVWIDRARQAGSVFARIDRGERQEWALDPTLSREALLDAAKDRAIDEAQARRETLLAHATRRLEQLEAAAS